jgi:hypothetical protein
MNMIKKEVEEKEDRFWILPVFAFHFGCIFLAMLTLCSFLDIDPRENTGNIAGLTSAVSVAFTWLAVRLHEINDKLDNLANQMKENKREEL